MSSATFLYLSSCHITSYITSFSSFLTFSFWCLHPTPFIQPFPKNKDYNSQQLTMHTSKHKYGHWLCLFLPTVSPHQSKPIVYSRIKEELESNKQEFTYAEVLSMTRNLERIVGKGGFGIVYHGCVGDIEVAVKMLSPSAQGYLQFQAEVVWI